MMMRLRKKHVLMIAYTMYSYDSRVRREAETLASDPRFKVLFLALKEHDSPRTYVMDGVDVMELNMEKYRGKSSVIYFMHYLKFMWFFFLKCTHLFLKGQVDIVHVHNMPDFLVFGAILPRFFGKKLVLDIHDSMPETYSTKFGNLSRIIYKILCLEESICCSLAHQVICVNHVQRDTLTRRGIPQDKISVIMNVPDNNRFNLGNKRAWRADVKNGRRMVYHGTVTKRQGVDLAIRSVSLLLKQAPDLEFHIWGLGDDVKGCMELIKRLRIEDQVHFHGAVSVDLLPEILREMDLGIVPNRKAIATDLMLPVKMLEYIALGIPVVAPRLKTIEYYFSDEMVSFFTPGNVDSLAKAIQLLYENETRRRDQVEKAHMFLEQYGWDKQRLDFLKFYSELSPSDSGETFEQ